MNNFKNQRLRKQDQKNFLTDIISLIRFATGQEQVLEPFSESVNEKFEEWLGKQERLGRKFTIEQKEWLYDDKKSYFNFYINRNG